MNWQAFTVALLSLGAAFSLITGMTVAAVCDIQRDKVPKWVWLLIALPVPMAATAIGLALG